MGDPLNQSAAQPVQMRKQYLSPLKSHLFRFRAIFFVVGSAADLTGNRGKRSLIPINLEAGHDLGVDLVEEVNNPTKETHSIMILVKFQPKTSLDLR